MNIPPYIQAGASCKLRNGERAIIYAVIPTNQPSDMVHGAIFRDGVLSFVWFGDGTVAPDSPSPEDIVGLWPTEPQYDPPIVDWSLYSRSTLAIAMDMDATWYEFQSVPEIHGDVWIPPSDSNGSYYIPIPFAPTYFGPWDKSLCVRQQG